MNINNFKEDEIITRVEASNGRNGDRSYMNDKLQFVGVQTSMIVLINLEEPFFGEVVKLDTDWWSEGWGYYPQNLVDKAVHKVKELLK